MAVGPLQRSVPEVAAAFTAIERDHPTRERYLAFARDADNTAVSTRMTAASAQVHSLESLAWQSLADTQSLQEIAGLFPKARSLELQRAIAGLLIRADTQLLARAELARTLRQHRLKSPDGTDVIEILIRMLQST